jgi:hypothetical protein
MGYLPAEIRALPIADLRPLILRALELQEWPGDWPAAGAILEQTQFQISRSTFNSSTVIIMAVGSISTAVDMDLLTAIFRAFLISKA